MIQPLRYAAAAAVTAAAVVAAGPGLIALLHPSPTPSDASPAPVRVEVTAVVDGDTIRVQTPQGRDLGRVRLLGVDAPGVAHPPAAAECYAEEATRLLTEHVPPGTSVELVADPGVGDRDPYGRMLRYLEHRGRDVAADLVVAGAVELYESGPQLARVATYRRAHAEAKRDRRGIFGNCSPRR